MTTELKTRSKAFANRRIRIGKDVEQIRMAGKQLATNSVDVVWQTANEFVEEG